MHQLVFNSVVREHHHDDEGVCINIDNVKAPYGDGHLCGEGQRRIIRQLGGKAAYVADGVVQLLKLLVHAAVKLLRLLQTQLLPLHQLVDVHPVARGGGDAAGGGVGLLKIAQTCKLGKLVADGGRGTAYRIVLRDGLAAHRLCRADILLNKGCKYFLFSFAYSHIHTCRRCFSTLDWRVLALSFYEC